MQTHIGLKAAMSAAVLAVSTMAANAAVVITTSASEPASFVDAVTTAVGSSGASTTNRFRTGGGDRDTGQIFTATDGYTVDSITVQVRNNSTGGSVGAGAFGAGMSLQFYSYDPAAPTPFTLLLTATGGVLPASNTAQTPLTEGTYLTFDLSDDQQPTLTAGQQYAYLIYFDAEAADRQLALNNSGDNNVYSDGRGIRREFDVVRNLATLPDAGNGSDTNKDYVFYVTAVADPVVPEPGAALAGTLVLGLLGARRRAR